MTVQVCRAFYMHMHMCMCMCMHMYMCIVMRRFAVLVLHQTSFARMILSDVLVYTQSLPFSL